MNKDFLSPLQW